MSTNSIGKTTARNSVYSMIANGFYLLSRFLLTPFILKYLSIEDYGLWSLCFVIISFLALTNIGLEGTYIKYVAEFHARQETDKINKLLSTGLLFTAVVSLLIVFGIWAGMPQILDMLRIDTDLHDKATFVFMATGLIFMLDVSLSCFGRVLDGLQRLDLTARVKLFTSIVELVLIVILLLSGFGIYGMVYAFLIRYLLAISINVRLAFKHLPGLKVSLHALDMFSLKLLASYGGKMQVLGCIGIFMSTFDKVIITRMLGLSYTGMYEIGRKIPATAARIPTEISGAMMPALSHLHGTSDMSQARMLFLDASRYMSMLSAGLFNFLFVSAPYAIYVWLGNGYEAGTAVMYIISAGTLVHLHTGTSSATARGINRLDWELKYGVLNLILCLILTPVLAASYGLAGAAGGVALSTGIASVYFIWLTNRFFKINLSEYIRKVLHPLVVSFLSTAALYNLLPLFITVGTTQRFKATVILICAGVLHLFFTFILLLITGGLLSGERTWLVNRVSTIKSSIFSEKPTFRGKK